MAINRRIDIDFIVKNIIADLRNGGFLTRERMTAWAAIFIVGYAIAIAYLGVTAHGLNDYAGRPLGTDFSDVYAAGTAASRDDATVPFNIMQQANEERAIFGQATPVYGWHYPPFFLLIATPLAHLPYLPALFVWQSVTLLLYLTSLALLLHKSASPSLAHDRLWPLLALGFSAVFVNLTHGQNGFLTVALFSAGLALLGERPLLSGVLFGLLAYKPQFVIVIPLVLVATGRWKTFASAAVTVIGLAIVVTLLFGTTVWHAFLASTHFTRVVVLEQGGTGFNKIQSVFAWVRMWGGPVILAYSIQALTIIIVAPALVILWRGNIGMGYKGAALCLAALLTTPYSLDYDLMLFAPVIALLVAEGKAGKFARYEALLLAVLWFVPLAARSIAHVTFIPVAVPAMIIAFSMICGRRTPAGDFRIDPRDIKWSSV